MKQLMLLLSILNFAFYGFACDCDVPKPALEFYESDYVFEGEAVSKIYSADSLTYTVKFEVFKHYKLGDNPDFLSYKLTAEGEFTGHFTSCDWNVELGEYWLVYSKEAGGEQKFSFYCSNSKPVNGNYKISNAEQKVLNNGNALDISKYRYHYYQAKPITNLDSILSKYNSKNLNLKQKGFAPFWIDVDKQGNLTEINLAPREKLETEVVDTIFGLNLPKNQYSEPRSDFQSVAFEIVKALVKWESYQQYAIPVKYRTYLALALDEKGNIVIYK
ncbi:MAG: hypothetical protein COA80_06470 [Leeuwenhoekiella sp.]|nr:MAG: hypothetical protein COA80_06470 [Leeuwenhoekiella sp.]